MGTFVSGEAGKRKKTEITAVSIVEGSQNKHENVHLFLTEKHLMYVVGGRGLSTCTNTWSGTSMCTGYSVEGRVVTKLQGSHQPSQGQLQSFLTTLSKSPECIKLPAGRPFFFLSLSLPRKIKRLKVLFRGESECP